MTRCSLASSAIVPPGPPVVQDDTLCPDAASPFHSPFECSQTFLCAS